MKHGHYSRDVSQLKTLDVYRLLELFGVTCPVAQHVIKKALVAGQRGHKDAVRDWQDIQDSAMRKLEMIAEDLEGAPMPESFGQQNTIEPEQKKRVIDWTRAPDWAEFAGLSQYLIETWYSRSRGIATSIGREESEPYTYDPLSVCWLEDRPEPAASMQDDSERMAAIGQNGNDGAVYLNYSCNSCGVAPGDKHKGDCQFYDQDGSAVIRNNQTKVE